MAEGLLRDRLSRLGAGVEVRSAGLAFDDRPATPEAVDASARRGVDISAHRSRIITAEMVESSDLVLGLERMHVREAILLAHSAAPRCFSLKELARRSAGAGPRAPAETLRDWAGRVSAGRSNLELLGASAEDDVADPYLQPPDVYERCVAEIAVTLERIVALAWPSASEGAA